MNQQPQYDLHDQLRKKLQAPVGEVSQAELLRAQAFLEGMQIVAAAVERHAKALNRVADALNNIAASA